MLVVLRRAGILPVAVAITNSSVLAMDDDLRPLPDRLPASRINGLSLGRSNFARTLRAFPLCRSPFGVGHYVNVLLAHAYASSAGVAGGTAVPTSIGFPVRLLCLFHGGTTARVHAKGKLVGGVRQTDTSAGAQVVYFMITIALGILVDAVVRHVEFPHLQGCVPSSPRPSQIPRRPDRA